MNCTDAPGAEGKSKTQNGLYFYLRRDIICGVKKRLCIHLKLDSRIMDIKRDFYLGQLIERNKREGNI